MFCILYKIYFTDKKYQIMKQFIVEVNLILYVAYEINKFTNIYL